MNSPRQYPQTGGFTLSELLLVCAIIGVLVAILLPVGQRGRINANVIKCTAQLKNLGIAAASYAAENRNEWPMYGNYDWPNDQQAWLTNRLRTGTVWTALGKTYPYHQDKQLFFCPAVPESGRTALRTADWRLNGSGDINGTYQIRGYGQVTPRPLARVYSALPRVALVSCVFAFPVGNPLWQAGVHRGSYPVLFSDGSVEVKRFPSDQFDLDNPPEIWRNNLRQIRIWEYFDGKTTSPNL